MRIAERLGAIAVAGLLATAVMTPNSADAQNGRIAAGGLAAGYLSSTAIRVGYGLPYPHRYGHAGPVCSYRPGSYTDAAQFWKSYQFYYAGCRRPPVRPDLYWDYVLVCCYGY